MAVRLGMQGYDLLRPGRPGFSTAGPDYTAQVTAQKMASFTLGVSPVSPLELANVGATLNSAMADGARRPRSTSSPIETAN